MNRMDEVSNEKTIEVETWLPVDAESIVNVTKSEYKRGMKQGVALRAGLDAS